MWARVGLVLLRDAHVGGRLENRGCREWKACVVGWGEVGEVGGGWVVCQEEMAERDVARHREKEWNPTMALGAVTSFNWVDNLTQVKCTRHKGTQSFLLIHLTFLCDYKRGALFCNLSFVSAR